MNNVCVIVTTTMQRYNFFTEQVYIQRFSLRKQCVFLI